MPNFHRYYIPGSLVFLTVVSKDRRPILASQENLDLFWQTAKEVKNLYPFFLYGYVLLPDHFHFLLKTEDPSGNYSRILHSLKRNYSLNYKKYYRIMEPVQLWQPRFWDHVIRNEKDLDRHIDYIHWNPVKHGYVESPEEWRQSSFRFWCDKAYYPEGWGRGGIPESVREMEFE